MARISAKMARMARIPWKMARIKEEPACGQAWYVWKLCHKSVVCNTALRGLTGEQEI